MAVKLKDVANKAGVSITTASMVLNNKMVSVSENTRKQILQAARELGYMRRERVNSIALMVPDLTNLYYTELTRSISLCAQKRGYNLLIFDSNNNPKREYDNLQALRQSNIEGVIMGISSTGDDLSRLIPVVRAIQDGSQTPIVLLDRSCAPFNCHTICINNFKGGYLASSHLLDLGHEKIGCITGPIAFSECQDRTNGFRQAFQERNKTFSESWLVNGGFTTDSGYNNVRPLIDQGVTAIFAQNDMIAFGVYQYLISHGYKIPRDISVVGFDNISFISIMDVPLTTVAQPIHEMGKRAFDILLNTPFNSDSADRVMLSLQPELVVRSSTAAPDFKNLNPTQN